MVMSGRMKKEEVPNLQDHAWGWGWAELGLILSNCWSWGRNPRRKSPTLLLWRKFHWPDILYSNQIDLQWSQAISLQAISGKENKQRNKIRDVTMNCKKMKKWRNPIVSFPLQIAFLCKNDRRPQKITIYPCNRCPYYSDRNKALMVRHVGIREPCCLIPRGFAECPHWKGVVSNCGLLWHLRLHQAHGCHFS